jgi:hypothetical protein
LGQLDALKRISDLVVSMGTTGVLLKGAALLAMEMERGRTSSSRLPTIRRRSAGDIDILVPSQFAIEFRSALFARGFTGDADSSRTGPHHLAPIFFRGIPVEIHTRVMPRLWKLPEKEMLEHTVKLNAFPALETLDAEGMLLHTLVHSSAHLYSRGLKASWDVEWLSQFSSQIDWNRVVRWAQSCAMPSAFFVPATVMSREMNLPSLEGVSFAQPTSRRARALERIASARLFMAREGAFEMNPITRNAFQLLLHDRWRDRLDYVRTVTGRDESESRRNSARRQKKSEQTPSRLIAEALGHFRAYRRATLEEARRRASAEAERSFAD